MIVNDMQGGWGITPNGSNITRGLANALPVARQTDSGEVRELR